MRALPDHLPTERFEKFEKDYTDYLSSQDIEHLNRLGPIFFDETGKAIRVKCVIVKNEPPPILGEIRMETLEGILNAKSPSEVVEKEDPSIPSQPNKPAMARLQKKVQKG